MTNYISTPLSTLNADLNTIQTALSSKADKSEIPEVPTDLSSFTNSPGFATSAYVQEYVDEHGGGTPSNLSDYVAISSFANIFALEQDATSSDMLTTINAILFALNGTDRDSRKTYVVYTDNSTVELNLTGNVLTSSIPNISNVKAISFGTNVTSFAQQLLYQKANLEKIEVPNTVTSIPVKFATAPTGDNGKLSSLVLPETLMTIGQEAFRGNALTSLTLPNSLTRIGDYGFSKSRYISDVYIGPNLSNLGSQVFGENMSLTAFHVDENNQFFKTHDGMLLNKTETTLWKVPNGITGDVVIPEGVTTLKFDSCHSLCCQTITLPSTLTTIDNAAFEGNSVWSAITIPSSVTSIGQYQFSGTPAKTVTFEGKTMAQVQAMSRYPWYARSGTQFVCTDGTITR